ncbi:MAG: RagB/SusD family nutrient uptake outer membrane protein [Gemmatimonadota bacterium]
MRNNPFTKMMRATSLNALLLVSPVLVALQACTDLEEVPVSAITPDNFYRNEQEVLGGLASVYADLRGDGALWGYYNLSEITTDEMIVPTRGQDWYDNGRWLEIFKHQWTANSGSGLDDINRVWVDSYRGVARANVVLDAMTRVTVPNQEVVAAELRTLRALYYYILLDMFGGVPIVTDTRIEARPRSTRAELFSFIETELKEAREVLPDRWPADMHGRMTKGAADAILASLYLNAEVWTGTVSVGGLQKGQAKWQDAINAADRVLNSGVYSLASNWRSNFTADNGSSPENILVAKNLNKDGLGLNFIMRALHYNQFNPSPWNGFSTLAETYNSFDADDARKQIFLVGCQVNVETGQPINDRSGKPLCYTPEIGDPTQASESEGVRIYKWPADPNHVAQENGNDYTYFRLAELYLIKAEALNELGRTPEAVALVNVIRARVFDPDEPLNPAAFTQASFRVRILQERLFELTAEAKRRQDLIRHGRFTAARAFKAQSDAYKILMPIPQSQLDTNPMLEQNPGY